MHKFLEGNGLRLAYKDFGGEGAPVVLLHGLFGRATTWAETARWLTPRYRVLALDQRGHGLSDKPENQYTREHYVADIAAFLEALHLGPAVLIGHSMGALNAWVLAARRPDLVSALVLEDMTAATAMPGDGERVRGWLDAWPVPFATMHDLRQFFGAAGRPGLADYFAEVVREEADGYRPLFHTEHMVQSAAGIDERDYWDEIDQVKCPALVVKGAESEFDRADLQEMARRMPQGRYVEIPEANHVVHFDQPVAWRVAVETFLAEVAPVATRQA